MIKPPLVFKTYQDVKNNLVYWTSILLLLSSIVIYVLILNPSQQQSVSDFVTSLASNAFLAALIGVLTLGLYGVIAIGLIYGIQIHDLVYDKLIIKWREAYDVDFILNKLTEPIKSELPKNFRDFAIRYRYQFMKPYYEFVGDGKKGIEENTRVRFYERVTWYWITQLNEIFILFFLIGTPIYVSAYSSSSMTINRFAIFILALVGLGLLNRWFIRLTRKATAEATLDEIEEILSKPENVNNLRERYNQLITGYKL